VSDSTKELSEIPIGHYHRVMESGNPIRRAWHLLKFRRVLDAFPPGPGLSLLDVGCFAGSLLSLSDETRFTRQLGVDILPERGRVNNYFKWFHVIGHEINHRGQISWLRIRARDGHKTARESLPTNQPLQPTSGADTGH